MHRLVLLIGLVDVLILVGMATFQGAMLALALPLLVLLAVGFYGGPQQPCLRVTRSLSAERVAPSVPVVVTVQVTNEGAALEEVLLEDLLPAGLEVLDGHPRLLGTLAAGETVELRYTVQGPRGYYHLTGVQATASDALGLVRRQVTVPTPGQFCVMPEVLKLGRVSIRPERTRPFSGLIPAQRGGPGIEFFGVREAQAGDPLRWVNWRACARHPETFYSNEFEQECVVDVSLILDVRRRSYPNCGDEALFEQTILAAAALAQTFLNDGNRVGLLLYGSLPMGWTLPGYGRPQQERILRALAEARPGESLDRLEYLPTQIFPVRSQLVLVSPLVREDLRMLVGLLAYGYPMLVISPNAVAFESRLLEGQPEAAPATRLARLERELLLRNLRRAGVHVVDWPVDRPLQQAVYSSLGRMPLWVRRIRVPATR